MHVTDLSWGRVRHPSDVVSVNQTIEVKILSLDPAKERISLSYKQTQPRPWEVAAEKYPVGSIVQGKVVRITTFGAFVELEPGLDGLVHISQCALTRIAKVEDAVSVGDVIRVKVLDVNPEARRISLSIRAVLEEEAFDGLNAPRPTRSSPSPPPPPPPRSRPRTRKRKAHQRHRELKASGTFAGCLSCKSTTPAPRRDGKVRMDQREILKHWYADVYEQRQTSVEDVACLLSLVGAEPKRILEVACGGGRICVPLAQAGHVVMGLTWMEPCSKGRNARLDR